MENDGTFECGQCPPGRTKLNIEDRNCWRCGSLNVQDMRPKPTDELVLLDVEEILRDWANTTGTTATSASTWHLAAPWSS